MGEIYVWCVCVLHVYVCMCVWGWGEYISHWWIQIKPSCTAYQHTTAKRKDVENAEQVKFKTMPAKQSFIIDVSIQSTVATVVQTCYGHLHKNTFVISFEYIIVQLKHRFSSVQSLIWRGIYLISEVDHGRTLTKIAQVPWQCCMASGFGRPVSSTSSMTCTEKANVFVFFSAKRYETWSGQTSCPTSSSASSSIVAVKVEGQRSLSPTSSSLLQSLRTCLSVRWLSIVVSISMQYPHPWSRERYVISSDRTKWCEKRVIVGKVKKMSKVY